MKIINTNENSTLILEKKKTHILIRYFSSLWYFWWLLNVMMNYWEVSQQVLFSAQLKPTFFFDFSYAEVNVISTTKSFTFGNDHKLKVVLDSDFPRHYFFFWFVLSIQWSIINLRNLELETIFKSFETLAHSMHTKNDDFL